MSIKKKLVMGAASAALGISLIGGGTWAAFNDVEKTANHIETGVLNLGLNPTSGTINLTKLVPGDTINRQFDLKNDGNIDIDKVLLKINKSGWVDYLVDGKATNANSEADFLSQFKVTLLKADGTDLLTGIVGTGGPVGAKYVSLGDIIAKADGTFKVSTGDGLPNRTADFDGVDYDTIYVNIEFVNDLSKDSDGEYVQNKYQGESVNLEFVFEATQKAGIPR